MRHGSLFSGIGGFDLAAQWMGWTNVFHCEWNPFGQRILKHYWPKAISYEDICSTDFTVHRGDIDILTGGFPCQPFSQAGKRKGTGDSRYLWPEMLRVIRQVRPTWVVGENVYGLVNWDGGVVFDTVCADLENEGFKVLPFVLPACSVNAPHRRDRIWFLAYSNIRGLEGTKKVGWDSINVKRKSEFGIVTNSNSDGFNQCHSNNEINSSEGGFDAQRNTKQSIGDGDVANTCCQGLQGGEIARDFAKAKGERKQIRDITRQIPTNWENFPTQSPICNGDDGLSSRLDAITFSKWRNESIKGGGNAIVPQVALQIFKTIESYG